MWWDWKGPVFYELLPKNKTINSDVYCEQLQKLSDAIAQKHSELINRKGVVFHHDNARPHKFGYSAKIVATWLGCVTTSTDSPDFVPSDFHLFRSLQNSLNGKTFASEENST